MKMLSSLEKINFPGLNYLPPRPYLGIALMSNE